ncbi:beta-glucosidase [Pontiella sulfatireligans]|uniref:Thermostable beta-glucosidase B n=1 Tax=Pontiella sulfatireligans TaxID=2750658 RepID=A0A6C2UNA6_9BACT|nr:glycoside hydrolase family 3 N-terminal domain-containing protein [Pontiella sulfatireligans]VGO20827.1 Thermostable beta-glucosidase B [Pontiella sulfatireligans]
MSERHRIGLGVLLATLVGVASGAGEPWRDTSLEPEMRVADLLGRMTTEEKVGLCFGSFVSGGIPRLGVEPLILADGPVGIRLLRDPKKLTSTHKKHQNAGDGEVVTIGADTAARTTALPGGLALAACWDRGLAEEYAAVMGREMRALGKHVLLAPGINMMRDPRGGRNYEYFGEDPYLTAEMAVAYVRGLQKYGVGANLKHFVANECETFRHYTSAKMDERVLREIYNYPFEQGIRRGGAWSLMTGNNLFAGTHVSENYDLLTTLLRDKIGFDGVILTDWRSAYRTEASAKAGLDMSTGFCRYVYGEGNLLRAVNDGVISEQDLDRMAGRVLLLYLRVGLLGDDLPAGGLDTEKNQAVARQVARDSIVLLKNKRALLPVPGLKTVLLCGPAADEVIMGTGSGLVNEGAGNISIKKALLSTLGATAVVHRESVAETTDADLDADLVVFCAHDGVGGEGADLERSTLPGTQAADIRALAARTDKLVVVLQCGTSVDTTDWDDGVDAFAVVWNGGQAFGAAVVDALTGKGDFTGRLPCVFGNPVSDWPVAGSGAEWPAKRVHQGDLPTNNYGKDRPQVHGFDAEYKEGLLCGHRWFIEKGIAQRYPFGFGLSRTTFELLEGTVEPVEEGWSVNVAVKNTGKVSGMCTVQLYVEDLVCSEERPSRELRGFTRVHVEPGQTTHAVMNLRRNNLCFYDVSRDAWKLEAGKFVLHVGTSSEHLPVGMEVDVEHDQWFVAP